MRANVLIDDVSWRSTTVFFSSRTGILPNCSCKQNCTSLSLHCFNEIRVLVCPWVSEDVVKHSWELLNFSLRGCLHDTSSLYAFHSDTSSLTPVPLASLYLLHDYSKKSRNSASHTWVSSYWYHVNMVYLSSFCVKLINHIAIQINLTSPWKKDFVTCGREILNSDLALLLRDFCGWYSVNYAVFSISCRYIGEIMKKNIWIHNWTLHVHSYCQSPTAH